MHSLVAAEKGSAYSQKCFLLLLVAQARAPAATSTHAPPVAAVDDQIPKKFTLDFEDSDGTTPPPAAARAEVTSLPSVSLINFLIDQCRSHFPPVSP